MGNYGATINKNVFYIFVGVMHSNPDIGQTTYSAIAYYDHIARPFTPDPNIDCFAYNGSGLVLPVPTNVSKEYLKNMFVVQLAHKENCIEGLKGMCLDRGQGEVYADVAIRNYLNPITKTAPLSTQIVPTIFLKFS